MPICTSRFGKERRGRTLHLTPCGPESAQSNKDHSRPTGVSRAKRKANKSKNEKQQLARRLWFLLCFNAKPLFENSSLEFFHFHFPSCCGSLSSGGRRIEESIFSGFLSSLACETQIFSSFRPPPQWPFLFFFHHLLRSCIREGSRTFSQRKYRRTNNGIIKFPHISFGD